MDDIGCVSVATRDGHTYRARYIIMALAPTMYGRMQFSPPLPSLRNQLVQRCPMGCIIKTCMYFKRPYWREKGLSGSALSDSGPVIYTYDDTKPDGTFPAIMGFVLAKRSREWTKRYVPVAA